MKLILMKNETKSIKKTVCPIFLLDINPLSINDVNVMSVFMFYAAHTKI